MPFDDMTGDAKRCVPPPSKEESIEMLLSFFQLSLAIRNVWPGRMSLRAFLGLYIPLLLAGMPVTFLSCIPYGLFGILVAACIYGLVICRDTAPQNVYGHDRTCTCHRDN